MFLSYHSGGPNNNSMSPNFNPITQSCIVYTTNVLENISVEILFTSWFFYLNFEFSRF